MESCFEGYYSVFTNDINTFADNTASYTDDMSIAEMQYWTQCYYMHK